MVDQALVMRAGQAGAEVKGTAGHVLTMQADGKVKPEAPALGALRAAWCVSPSSPTFAPDQPGPLRDIVSEPGTFTGIAVGDTVFFPAQTCLQGGFHSGVAAPQLGGLYVVVTTDGAQEMSVQRAPSMLTAAQIDGVALVACDQGTGAGVWQVATPAAAVVDTDPQVHFPVSLVPPDDNTTYALQATSRFLSWVEVVP